MYYKTRVKTTVLLSSNETEFIASCDAVKVIICIRFILDDISIPKNRAKKCSRQSRGSPDGKIRPAYQENNTHGYEVFYNSTLG